MKWAPDADFDITRRYFAFPCIDLVVLINDGVILIKRDKPPYRGYWHLPGGIIHKGQTFLQKIKEVSEREIGSKVDVVMPIGVYENIHRYRHDISYSFIVAVNEGNLSDFNLGSKIFKKIPDRTIPYHKSIIKQARKLMRQRL